MNILLAQFFRSFPVWAALVLCFNMCSANRIYAQSGTIVLASSIVDSASRSPVPGARIQILRLDSTVVTGTVADRTGVFFVRVQPGEVLIKMQSVGYTTKTTKITIPSQIIGLADTLRLPPMRIASAAVKTGEVEVSTTALRAEVRGDTTEFNAKAFKTDKNAAAEDLIRKMPGVEIDPNGTVKAQGENVRRVLVDGKPFFGDDPTAALRNLPAEIIDKVQVIDQMSDQAAFTRFDDGDRTKTLNILTNPNRRNGQFGKVYGGFGSNTDRFESRYTAGGNMNLFNGDRRVSILGMSNNINQQNFSIQDILGAMGGGANNQMMRMIGGAAAMRSGGSGAAPMIMRMGGGGGGVTSGNPSDFLVPQSDGITAAHGLGLNYSDSWGKNVNVTGSYFVNFTDNTAQQDVQRQYFLANGVPPQTSTQATSNATRNMNHRVNLRVEATLDSSNSLIFTPRFTVQDNNRSSLVKRATFAEAFGALRTLNTTGSDNTSHNAGYSFGGELLWRHKFPLEGRTLSVNFAPSYNRNTGDQINNSINGTISGRNLELAFDTVRQETPIFGTSRTLGGNISYTEPIHDKGSLQAAYNVNWTTNESDRSVFDFSRTTGDYTQKNTQLSNVFTSSYLTHRPGISYRYAFTTGANFSVGVDYQSALLSVAQEFPSRFDATTAFTNVLPSASFTMRFGKAANFRANYRTSTHAPSIRQLQNVLDFSDPLRLSIGNPDLRQEYTHTISANYGAFDIATANSLFLMLTASFTNDKIVNSTIIATRDTLILPERTLAAGGQFIRPVNTDGYWTARAFGTYSFPLELWQGAKLNVNAGFGVNYTRDVSLINNARNTVDNYGVMPSLTVSSNISENLDFTLSGRSVVTIARNSLQPALDNTFLVHTVYAKLNWVFWEGFMLSSDFTYISNNGLADGFNQAVPLLSVGVGKRFFSDNLEIKLSAFDALNQNTAIARNVSATYIEDAQTVVLRRYLLLMLTYNLRNFVL